MAVDEAEAKHMIWEAVDPITGAAMTRTYGLMTPFETKMKELQMGQLFLRFVWCFVWKKHVRRPTNSVYCAIWFTGLLMWLMILWVHSDPWRYGLKHNGIRQVTDRCSHSFRIFVSVRCVSVTDGVWDATISTGCAWSLHCLLPLLSRLAAGECDQSRCQAIL